MFLSIVVFLFLSESCVISLSHPEVNVQQGTLRGIFTQTIGKRKIASFLGIPFSKPIIGRDKFKEASEAEPWSGIYNATRPPPNCLQLDHFLYKTQFAVHGSEDCLYLNVFTPKVNTDRQDNDLLDVIAFIHGGAFMMMSSTFFKPSILLDRDVVLVTFNYRLGPLGFLSTEDDVVPGNNGLKDQILALKWIQNNIASFGGNPKSVTLAGISAGSASVHYHILSPLSKGLFHKAILMSGTTLNPWTQAEKGNEKAKYIANMLGCPTHDSRKMVDCLQERPADHIVGICKDFLKWLYNPFSPFAPVIEPTSKRAFISEKPIDIIKRGAPNDVPILASFAADEGIYPGSEIIQKDNLLILEKEWDTLIPYILDYNYTVLPSKRISIGQEIKSKYQINLNEPKGIKNFIEMLGDRLFINGIYKAIKIHASVNTFPIYLYKFSYKGKNSGTSFFSKEDLGVSHGDDLFYILFSNAINTQETENDRLLSRKMVDLWVTFASKGSLEKPWVAVNKEFPKIPVVNIKGPDDFSPEHANDLGEEYFWDSLNLQEN